jgi:hypothetical protein
MVRLGLRLLGVLILVADDHLCRPFHDPDLCRFLLVQPVGRGQGLGRQRLVGGRRRQDSRQVVQVALDHALFRGEPLVQASKRGLGDPQKKAY